MQSGARSASRGGTRPQRLMGVFSRRKALVVSLAALKRDL